MSASKYLKMTPVMYFVELCYVVPNVSNNVQADIKASVCCCNFSREPESEEESQWTRLNTEHLCHILVSDGGC